MSSSSQAIGKLGEDIALSYLKKKHYQILERNFRFSNLGEIDIIARHPKGQIVFLEVKTKKSENFGLPENEFTFFKRKKLKRVIQIYLMKNFPQEENWQMDLIAIKINSSSKIKISHYLAV